MSQLAPISESFRAGCKAAHFPADIPPEGDESELAEDFEDDQTPPRFYNPFAGAKYFIDAIEAFAESPQTSDRTLYCLVNAFGNLRKLLGNDQCRHVQGNPGLAASILCYAAKKAGELAQREELNDSHQVREGLRRTERDCFNVVTTTLLDLNTPNVNEAIVASARAGYKRAEQFVAAAHELSKTSSRMVEKDLTSPPSLSRQLASYCAR